MTTIPVGGEEPQPRQAVVNDFVIKVATANGSGSQTSNLTLIRALFKMGIPVNGKNLFPSNIKGLPTWYIVRLSKDAYVARREQSDILVAMNQKTVADDHAELAPGCVFLYDESLRFEANRPDLIYYPIPVKQLTKGSKVAPALRNYVANMVYVGALAYLINIPLVEVGAALSGQLEGKAKAIALNMEVAERSFNWAAENITKRDPFLVEPMGANQDKIMLDGNSAAALGAIYGGVTFASWYPITPSTSLIEALNSYLPRLRQHPKTNQPTYCVAQAEDELAAIGMVFGAGWTGARAMTATSGPGLSLMAEFAGLGYFAEIPAVIWDVMRMGPSTGLPTRVSQGDLSFAYNLGHGDSKQVCLLPASIEECFEFAYKAFDLAEQTQTPVFVLSDLDLGMNQWVGDPFEYPAEPMDRGKVLSAQDLEQVDGFARYRDVDGDGITYRTLPGTDHSSAAYFTRGTGHDTAADYSERADDWENNLKRLARKFDSIRKILPKPLVDIATGSAAGLIAYGSSDGAVVEARDLLLQRDIALSYLRLRALPINDTVINYIENHDRVYIIENNFSGQLAEILSAELPHLAPKLVPLAKCDGLPLTADWILTAFEAEERTNYV